MKVFKNGIYASLDVIFAPFFLVIATPIFINKLGVENYGLWVLVNSIVSSLSLFNFGVNETIIKYISEREKENDQLSKKKIFSSVVTFQLLLTICVTTVIFLLSFINNKFEVIKFNGLFNILIFAIPLFFTKQIEQALFALHKAHEDFEYMVKQSFLSKFFFYISQIIVVIILRSVLSVFQISLIVAAFYLCYQFYNLSHKYDGIFHVKYANIATFKSLFKEYGKWAWLSSSIAIINSNIDKWLVSGILGLTIFGYYAIGVLILNQLYTIISASISWIFPKIASNEMSESEKNKTHLRLTFFVVGVGFIVSLFLEKLDFFFILWLGQEVFNNCRMYIHVFLYLLPVWLLSSVSYYYILGMGMVKNKFYADVLVLIAKLSVIYIVLLKIHFIRWPIFYLIPILLEVILYMFIINKKNRLNISHLTLMIIFNILLLVLRFKEII